MQQVNTTKGGLVATKPLKFEQQADMLSRKNKNSEGFVAVVF
jgi:hypothetical protein